MNSLVNYSDSSDSSSDTEQGDDSVTADDKQQAAIHNNIPQLPVEFDHIPHLKRKSQDTGEHLGRKRSVPHIQGTFATHIYVSVPISEQMKTKWLLKYHDIMKQYFKMAKLQSIHDIGNWNSPQLHHSTGELHISLSRVLYLKEHQLDSFYQTLHGKISECPAFSISLDMSTVVMYENDEKTRRFVAVDVGDGHGDLQALTDIIDTLAISYQQLKFYSPARFHASFMWSLPPSPANEDDNNGNSVITADLIDFVNSNNTTASTHTCKIHVKQVYCKIRNDTRSIKLSRFINS